MAGTDFDVLAEALFLVSLPQFRTPSLNTFSNTLIVRQAQTSRAGRAGRARRWLGIVGGDM